jgi:hypothetical protein
MHIRRVTYTFGSNGMLERCTYFPLRDDRTLFIIPVSKEGIASYTDDNA